MLLCLHHQKLVGNLELGEIWSYRQLWGMILVVKCIFQTHLRTLILTVKLLVTESERLMATGILDKAIPNKARVKTLTRSGVWIIH